MEWWTQNRQLKRSKWFISSGSKSQKKLQTNKSKNRYAEKINKAIQVIRAHQQLWDRFTSEIKVDTSGWKIFLYKMLKQYERNGKNKCNRERQVDITL